MVGFGVLPENIRVTVLSGMLHLSAICFVVIADLSFNNLNLSRNALSCEINFATPFPLYYQRSCKFDTHKNANLIP
jgi:hypothetical protein